MLIAVISDTHMPRGARRLPDTCVERIASAEMVLHAGDVMTAAVLDEIEAIGPPVVAVQGNMDDAALRRRFGERADAVVFGHSHLPLYEERDGFQIFNPGSPTERRRAPAHTMGLARVEGGRVAFELLEL